MFYRAKVCVREKGERHGGRRRKMKEKTNAKKNKTIELFSGSSTRENFIDIFPRESVSGEKAME